MGSHESVGRWLVAPLTSFIGREPELADLRQILRRRRLVTLTGPAGVGKTRLAMECASGRIRRGGFVVGAQLAALAVGSLLEQEIAATFGLALDRSRGLDELLAFALGARPCLLVLDNCEHLLEGIGSLAGTLLAACSSLRILATSRERLGVAGETVYSLPPLPVPDESATAPDDVLASSAAELFVERAGHSAPGFELTRANSAAVAEICRRLDGLPLALELAAGRLSVRSPAELAAGLGDRFALLARTERGARPQHQTLRAMLDWSYALLSDIEQRVLRRLAAFRSTF